MNNYRSAEIYIGGVALGGDNPVRLQSMANESTLKTGACVDQSVRMIKAGAEIVRYAVRNIKEAENLAVISEELKKLGFATPLVADVHFNPDIALTAAVHVEKVRVNPGNYAHRPDSDISFEQGARLTKERFIPLLETCKKYNTALRIGSNHGSLSRRMTEKYGDTPAGMVASVMEYLQICVDNDFIEVVVSLKSSNIKVMIEANRLMAQEMVKNEMYFPFHLGVTEAGDAEAGRVKSAAGIGVLLQEGIGDTIRVSLTEPPEDELPVARKIVDCFSDTTHKSFVVLRKSIATGLVGGNRPPVVIASDKDFSATGQVPDFSFVENKIRDFSSNQQYILPYALWKQVTSNGLDNKYPFFGSIHELNIAEKHSEQLNFVALGNDDQTEDIQIINNHTIILVIALDSERFNNTISHLAEQNISYPLIIRKSYAEQGIESLQVHAAGDLASYLVNRRIDGVWIEHAEKISYTDGLSVAFSILQATGTRLTKTEYIACPSCGRTLFDIQKALEAVKAKTYHLKGLKIAVMGCIVNGPGEMADADYGYIGSGQGKVTLYKKRTPVKKNIPEQSAVDELVDLIKKYGDWQE